MAQKLLFPAHIPHTSRTDFAQKPGFPAHISHGILHINEEYSCFCTAGLFSHE